MILKQPTGPTLVLPCICKPLHQSLIMAQISTESIHGLKETDVFKSFNQNSNVDTNADTKARVMSKVLKFHTGPGCSKHR